MGSAANGETLEIRLGMRGGGEGGGRLKRGGVGGGRGRGEQKTH